MVTYQCTCHQGSPSGFELSNAQKLENLGLVETTGSPVPGLLLSQSEILGTPSQVFCDKSQSVMWVMSLNEGVQRAHIIDAADLTSGTFELLDTAAKAGKNIPVHCVPEEPVDTQAPGDHS